MNDAYPRFEASIYLSGKEITYRLEKNETVFEIERIQLIGEFYSPSGPLGSNYFFSFKLRGMEQPIDIPSYCEGLFETLGKLKSFLPDLQNPRLQLGEGHDSNVLYPKKYAGHPLYRFAPESKPLVNLPVLRHIVQVESVKRELNPLFELN